MKISHLPQGTSHSKRSLKEEEKKRIRKGEKKNKKQVTRSEA
jgi:hypothetical protein